MNLIDSAINQAGIRVRNSLNCPAGWTNWDCVKWYMFIELRIASNDINNIREFIHTEQEALGGKTPITIISNFVTPVSVDEIMKTFHQFDGQID